MRTTVVQRYVHPKYPRLSLQLRSNSRFLQAITFLDGRLRQKTTGSSHLPTALKIAEDWYRRELRASHEFGHQHPMDPLTADPTIAELHRSYRAELPQHKQANSDAKWNPIADFWRARTARSVTPKVFKEFYGWRRRKNITNHTLHKDVVLIRQILKHGLSNGVIDQLPYVPPVGKIAANPRPWLTKTEWEMLKSVSLNRIRCAPNERTRAQRTDLHDLIEFLVDSMMRVDELYALRYSSCREEQNPNGHPFLVCEVSGKTGTRTVITQRTACLIYRRRLRNAHASDLLFPHRSTDAFRELLEAASLRTDPFGFRRNLKSLRATSISFKLLDQPDLHLQIVARNAGTSVQMIDSFYSKRLTAEMHKDVLSTLPKGSARTMTESPVETFSRLWSAAAKERLSQQSLEPWEMDQE